MTVTMERTPAETEAGVIKDARRRQWRRRALIGAVAVIALAPVSSFALPVAFPLGRRIVEIDRSRPLVQGGALPSMSHSGGHVRHRLPPRNRLFHRCRCRTPP